MDKTTTIRVQARQYEDHDDCLQAAVDDYVEEHPELKGWNLSPRWEDNSRDVILLDVPEPAEAKRVARAAAVLGRKGGLVKSDAKTAAVRANGALGGRPAQRAAILADLTPNRATVLWIGEGRDIDGEEVYVALDELGLSPDRIDPKRVRLISAEAKIGERIWRIWL